jgi:hypothetical protein
VLRHVDTFSAQTTGINTNETEIYIFELWELINLGPVTAFSFSENRCPFVGTSGSSIVHHKTTARTLASLA